MQLNRAVVQLAAPTTARLLVVDDGAAEVRFLEGGLDERVQVLQGRNIGLGLGLFDGTLRRNISDLWQGEGRVTRFDVSQFLFRLHHLRDYLFEWNREV